MKTRLFLNYYIDRNPERQKELDYCLNMNQINPLIDKIYVLADSHVPATTTITFTNRPTFSDFFRMVNDVVEPDDITIVANSDIYFTETLKYLDSMTENDCYALSRTDNLSWDSQDAWIFKGRIREINADFRLGIPGCDNRLAYELSEAGYMVNNPSRTIHAVHVHTTNIRNYDEKTTKIPKPYLLLTPCRLGENSQTHLVR